jgi:GT2 family glycosyltransferase
VPIDSPEISAVVVTHNNAAHIRPSLSSLQKGTTDVIVIDNGSRDDTRSIVAHEFPRVRVIASDGNLGYGRALNRGIAETHGPYILAANADTFFPDGSLQELGRFMVEHPQVGVAGPQQVFPDGSWQRSYGDVQGIAEIFKSITGLPSLVQIVRRALWPRKLGHSVRRVGYVDGAVMLIRRVAFDQVGKFDEAFPYYCEDADFCLRVRKADWQVVNVPWVHVMHVRGGSSTKVEGYSEKLLRVQAAAYCRLVEKHDPRHLWLYRRMCTLHAKKMVMIYKILQTFSTASYAAHASARALLFERWARIWNEKESNTPTI